MTGAHTRWLAVALATIVLLSAIAVGGAAPALADDDPDPVPAAYYGTVEIDGEPAPEGTEIAAVIDGEVRGTITVDEAGEFGGSAADEDKLVVEGTTDDAGEPVDFLVNQQEVDHPTVEWESGDSQSVALEGDGVDDLSIFDVDIDENASDTDIDVGETATVVADIENTGDTAGETDVTFEVNDTVEDDIEDLELDVDETETVEFDIELDEEGDVNATVKTDDDQATVTLSADDDDGDAPGISLPSPDPAPDPEPEAEFDVTDVDLDATQLLVGESVTVTATIENVGEESGETTAALVINGETVDEQDVTVDAGATATVTFTETFDEAGEYDVAVGEFDADTITVSEPEPAAFDVDDVQVTDDEIVAGDEIDISATIENVGDEAGTFTAELLVDGEVVDEQDVTVDGNDAETVTFTEAFDESGEFDVTVGDADPVTITVTDDDGIPGFSATAAVVALLAVALLARRL
ncbi:CARDB domain-containing protein [Halobiforma nitratireducens]|uniref:CARDB domain-containing protein n=1 Tax=Halobiforma nitratireducens JCM 10879 TaxID=1227454 RepID=M0M131_9EURY|nr:CARDB domain-containing protein [Halobiforma nitratireducens]EMA38080.1 hypothetical protein C446_10320 [Halobiforma nitratireducens JCM 10879]